MLARRDQDPPAGNGNRRIARRGRVWPVARAALSDAKWRAARCSVAITANSATNLPPTFYAMRSLIYIVATRGRSPSSGVAKGWFMRLTASIPVVLALTASIWAIPARADDWDLCKDEKLAVEQSIAACTRAINSKKFKARDLSTLYYNRAISYRQQGNNGQALADYNEAIRVDPRNEKPYNNRGN